MFHSHSIQDNAFNYFASFLENAITGNKSYEDLVKPTIMDAHLLATGEKNYYNIGRDNFQVITYLVEKEKSYFAAINIDSMQLADYSHILNLVTSQRDVIYA
jgi:hypothetical protein